MSRILFLIHISLVLCTSSSVAQQQDTATIPGWDHNLETNLYFFEKDAIFLPVYHADKGKLHLEARYNYEDIHTFSAWIGYNFSGGKSLQYLITPMAAGVVGRLNGLAVGLEVTLGFKDFQFYSESEHMFDLSDMGNNFFYNWTDISFAPTEWLFFGLSGQRTRLYNSKLDIQRGIFVGGSYRRFELSAYLYNLGFDKPFILLTLGVNLSKL